MPSSPNAGYRPAHRRTSPAVEREPRKATVKVVVVAACAVALLAALYLAGCLFFYGRFLPNTRIGATDVSLMSAKDATGALQRVSNALSVRVDGYGLAFTLNGTNAGLELNVEEAVAAALGRTPVWQWPYQVFLDHNESRALTSSFNMQRLRQTVEVQLAAYNELASGPVDASLYYDEAGGVYRIDPGAQGTRFDVESVVQTVVEALANERGYVPLGDDNLARQQVGPDDPALLARRDAANALIACNVDLVMGGATVATLNPALVHTWVVFGEDGSARLDETKLVAWVDELEARLDSVGDTRSYTRPDGKAVSVSGGWSGYGWISDGAALEQLVRDCIGNGTTGQVDVPLKQAAAVYNPGGKDWPNRYIDVDLSEQYVRLYDESSALIWESPCITGLPGGHESPTGVYAVNAYKATGQTLTGQIDPATGKPEYESYVSYWMPFVGNMVGLHDATWQSYWGSDAYLYNGSHGCINLPYGAAESLYGLCRVGDVVVVHY